MGSKLDRALKKGLDRFGVGVSVPAFRVADKVSSQISGFREREGDIVWSSLGDVKEEGTIRSFITASY